MAARVRLDHKGLAEVLRSAEVRREIAELTEQVADNARAQGHTVSSGEPLPVEASVVTTDRAHGSVTIAHPAGVGMQAKYGVLTKAAAAAGLEVTEK
jgi:hypothetical protein